MQYASPLSNGDSFGSASRPELGEYVFQMRLDRSFADIQLRRDAFVAPAACDMSEYIVLALRKRIVQDARGDLCADGSRQITSTGLYDANTTDNIVDADVFGQIAPSPGA